MTLYFENALKTGELSSISLNVKWHPNAPLLAVASFSQEKGGFVTVFDELGDSLKENNYPFHRNYQITSFAWHPEIISLATGWENGEIKIWNEHENDFLNVNGPHKAPITHVEYSEKGGRLASCDSSGALVGWKVDPSGHIVTVFHLDLKECVTHLTFRLTVIGSRPGGGDYVDVKGLAKAAVNGDEDALDLFDWRPKTTARRFRMQDGLDNMCFFVGTQVGSLYYVNSNGSCTEVLNTEGVPLANVLYHRQKDHVIVIMEGLTIGNFSVDRQGNLIELGKVKLSGRVQTRGGDHSQKVTWCGNDQLAVITGDLVVRIWDAETNDNYTMPTAAMGPGAKLYVTDDRRPLSTASANSHETFSCVSYCRRNGTLCAGTNLGKVYFWTRRRDDNGIELAADAWELDNANSIGGTVKHLTWGESRAGLPLLAVNCVTSVYAMKERAIGAAFSRRIWAVQKTAMQLVFETDRGSSKVVSIDHQVTDVSLTNEHVAFTNGRIISIYRIVWNDFGNALETKPFKEMSNREEFVIEKMSHFNLDNEAIELCENKIVVLTPKGVIIKDFSGVTVFTVANNANEGEAIGFDVKAKFLTIFTLDGYLKIYDTSSSDNVKLHVPIRNAMDARPDFGEIIEAKTNSSGTKLAMTIAASNLIPDGKLYIWDLEHDIVFDYDFKRSNEEISYDESDNLKQNANKNDFEEICTNRVPLSFQWDEEDQRLLVTDAKLLKYGRKKRADGKQTEAPKENSQRDRVIVTMFVSSEDGIKLHDVKPIERESRLLSVATPHIALLSKLSIVRETMSDFVGLNDTDKTTREAVLDFSYNLSLGNMDAAFKSIKLVTSTGVWNSLARMCVKTRRLDVAAVCLGHMGNARAARALRLAVNNNSLPIEAKVAVLATQLGMLDEAEDLYRQCNRYDLLNRHLSYKDKMDEAFITACSMDRINVRNTEHTWARQLEFVGDFKGATKRYEKANTHRYDVPRMLIDRPEALKAYMTSTDDKELLKWWGQYLESLGDMNGALSVYAKADDAYSQVRVLCYLGEKSKAADLARTSQNKAALYHMARHYESVGDNDAAVKFFAKANAYGNAARLCKENHMTDELWDLSLVAPNQEKIECARYFQEVVLDPDRAVELYRRAGALHKAIDLCLSAGRDEILKQVAADLDETADPALLEKCAEFFVKHEEFDKAMDMLAVAKKFPEAIELCRKHNVRLTEDLAAKLTPDKDMMDETQRIAVLEILGDGLMLQGSYHLAAQKYTQAGDKIKAMKALLKSGDTERIVFFAHVSRNKDIYVLAANYLQTTNWRDNVETLRNIVAFYSKAKAMDLLANFYVACAQVEIDEFQNYEKAHEAYIEANTCLSKVTTPKDKAQHNRVTELVRQRIAPIKKFLDAKKLFDRGDHQAGLAQARLLLTEGGQQLEEAVRRGDIYCLMIQNCIKIGNFSAAKQLFDEFKETVNPTTSIITYFMSREVLDALAKGLNMPLGVLIPSFDMTSNQNDLREGDDDIEEELE